MKSMLEKTEVGVRSSDSDLINDTLAGNKSAFGELVSKYQKRIYRLAYRIIGNPTDSADIAQETFVHAYQNLKRLKNTEKFQQWLCQIAKNQCLDWIRKRQDNLIAIEDEIISNSLYLPPAPDEILIEQELYDQVMKAIENLPEHNRKVAQMFYLEGKSYSEIQNELGITKGTLGRWLYEARHELIKATKHFAGSFAFRFNDCMSHLSKLIAGTNAISITKCLVISIALHLIIFAQLSGNGIGYHANKGNSYDNSFMQSSADNHISVEYMPVYSQISASGLLGLSKRDNILKQESTMDNDKKAMSLHTVEQSIKSPNIYKPQNSVIVPLPQHINMRYNTSLTYAGSPQSEKSEINPVRMAGTTKPVQIASGRNSPVSGGLSEIKSDETQKPSLNTEAESEGEFEHYVLVRSFPEKPSTKYGYPSKFAVDNQGNIYISDMIGSRIVKLSSDGTILTSWGEKGHEDGQFKWPYGIAVDNSGDVYVADSGNYRIQKFDSNGKFIAKWGKKGYAAGTKNFRDPYSFKRPLDIAIDDSGYIYVVDSENNCVIKSTLNGEYRHKFGEKGSRDGQFRTPTSIAVDKAGNIYVADGENHRIQKFNVNIGFIIRWGTIGTSKGFFKSYFDLAIDSDGNVLACDSGNNRIQKFAPDGTLLAVWGQKVANYDHWWRGERKPEPDDGFIYPSDIAVDKDGNVYVLDSWRIKIFRQANK